MPRHSVVRCPLSVVRCPLSVVRLRTAGNGARTTVLILNTHDHGDHTGGNEVFGKDAPIIAHENVRKRLQSGTTATGRTVPPNGEEIRASTFPAGTSTWFADMLKGTRLLKMRSEPERRSSR